MQLMRVKSSAIRSIGYRGDRQQLHVVFASGRMKVYRDIPTQTWQEFIAAPSKGTFYNTRIKKQRKAQKEKVTP